MPSALFIDCALLEECEVTDLGCVLVFSLRLFQ